MPIPDYQSLMLPLLKAVSDGELHLFKDVVNVLTVKFNLTEDEQKELLPSGQAFLFPNRVGWARTYLKKAGLIDTPKRGILVITPRGRAVLKKKPERIDNNLLKQFPEFVEFQHYKKKDSTDTEVITPSSSDEQTPEEIIENVYQKIRGTLSIELLDTVRGLSPFFFERLVVELLVKMGYGGSIKDAGEVIKKTGDEGIDGTIKEDKLGLDIIYIQAKRWEGPNYKNL